MTNKSTDALMSWLEDRNPGQAEYLQAAEEIVTDVWDLVADNDELRQARVLERLLEPDRIVSFRVTWEDDDGSLQINRAFRVQTCNALGPYKGGLRFHPTVNESILKFLGLEQTLKNSLTNLSIGGAKGGADFAPANRSDSEVRRFCRSFMTELVRHIGPGTDVPAGDIGVGDREIGYLFGQYKRLSGAFAGALTGKPIGSGGIELRSEATGYGVVYFTQRALAHYDLSLEGRRCAVSGAGNVARFCAAKLLEQDASVVTLSDSRGSLHAEDGLTARHLDWLTREHARLPDLAAEFDLDYREGEKPWTVSCDLAFPCATQNELEEDDADALVDGGCRWVVEGANMPCTATALDSLRDGGVTVCPGKAANAGGVVVSALEMSQNASFLRWSSSRVDELLRTTMAEIHDRCADHLEDGADPARADYPRAANRAGFLRVGHALAAQGF